MPERICACEGHTLDRLLQPTVIALLAKSPLHGYSLVKQLADSPMMGGSIPDRTGLYRLLASMEEQGTVIHQVASSEVGPAKRVYELTDYGRCCFAKWINTLEQYQQSISELLDLMRKSTEVLDAESG